VRRLFLLLLVAATAAVSAPRSVAEDPKSQGGAPAPGAPSEQAQIPAFAAQVDQVTVDAVVTDKKGSAMGGLTAADFTVLEDGVPQTLSYFEAIEVPAEPSATPPPKPRVASNASSAANRRGRTFVILFDDVHTTRGNGERAKTAIAQFLQTGVREGDHVTLVSAAGDAWWTARMEEGRDDLLTVLKRLEGRYIPDRAPDRISDYEAMRIQLYDDQDTAARVARRFESTGAMTTYQSSSPSMGGRDPFIWARAREVYFQAVARTRVTLRTLRRVLESLEATKGRKSVILVTDGFVNDPSLGEFKDIVKASRRANAAIYTVDSIGLTALPVGFGAESSSPIANIDVGAAFMDASMSVGGGDDLAEDTGGFAVRNSNDLARGIERIADESRVYYLLGYIPTNGAQDGKFRKIEVKVGRKDVKIRARKGYYAPLPPGQTVADDQATTKSDPVFQQALDAPYQMSEIPMRMTAYVFGERLFGKAETTVVTEVDLRGFAFQEKEGRFADTLEFLIVVAHRDSGEYWRYDQKINMNLLPATRDRLDQHWMPISRDFELGPGAYQAKMVVRDANSGKVGSIMFGFEVPDLTAFRTSTLTLSDTLRPTPPGEESETPRPVLLARRTFEPNAHFYALFSVFGAAKDEASGMPKVSAGYQILAADGTIKGGAPPSSIQPTSLGNLSRLVGTSLAGYAPGEYQFALSVKDEITGKTIEVKEPFTVVAPERASASGR
jgi:VWFA-related protein